LQLVRENQTDASFMKRALQLARRGQGRVLPNPLVGAIVVKDGQVIGEGFHRRFGGPHAEVFALQEAGDAARDSTLYVILEPCSHFGKTPPCTQRIIAAGVRRVVVAMQDPNPLVNGRGMDLLRRRGIAVESGILEDRARALNAPFVKFIRQQIPYVTLKIAQTLDGRIADSAGGSKWITGPAARRLVHRWRWQAGAVLVGIGTVLADDPALTVRHVRGDQPWRIVLDSRLRIPLESQLLNDAFVHKTIILAGAVNGAAKKADRVQEKGARVLPVAVDASGRIVLRQALHELAGMNIAHVFVEGGQAVFSNLLREGLADRVAVFVAAKMFGAGLPAVDFSGFGADAPLAFASSRWRRVGEDMLFEGLVGETVQKLKNSA